MTDFGALQDAILTQPKNALAWAALSNAQLQRGAAADSECSARQAVSLDESVAAGWRSLANACIAQSKWSDAARALQHALAIDAQDALTWADLGTVEQHLGHRAAAEAAYELSLSLAPGNPSTLTNLAFLLRHVAGVTGALATFQGRERRVTPHTWMVNEGLLDLRISYRNADKLWLRVIPLRGNRHTLTCYVINAADCNTDSPYHGREIYHHQKGRRSTYPYRFFKDDLLFRLPIRNVSWSRIREVRMAKESARYEGFDRTSRQLINHVFQGGTADIVKTMMLRMQDVCAMFCARLLLNIHDELVYEVPDEVADQFTQTALWVLELRPTADFEVPIVVEPKVGKRFDELAKWQPIYWWD